MQSILDALRRRAANFGNLIAFWDPSGRISYADLAGRVGGLAQRLATEPTTIGLFGTDSIDWLVADLAISASGRTAVPLPAFFSQEQTAHLLADAGVSAIVATSGAEQRAAAFGLPTIAARHERAAVPDGCGGKIIYTSGSTGRPKGVRLGARQIDAVTAALAIAIGADEDDCHLSVLPYALLLETVCGIYLPILAGAEAVIVGTAMGASPETTIAGLTAAIRRHVPTTTVLVPDLLAAWLREIDRGEVEQPLGLRFVAVGGAPIAPEMAAKAWDQGIPVHEGYGLSECASVVAVNRPGRRKAGTVGEPLPGVQISFDRDEILVSSATVMDGYAGFGPADIPWRTGDLGRLDADGFLEVWGRQDNLIVLASGRNVSPEWVETAFAGDTRIERTVLLGHGRHWPLLLVWPSAIGRSWFAKAGPQAVRGLIEAVGRDLPAYARPGALLVIDDPARPDGGLFTANGRPRRKAIAEAYAADIDDLYDLPEIRSEADGVL